MIEPWPLNCGVSWCCVAHRYIPLVLEHWVIGAERVKSHNHLILTLHGVVVRMFSYKNEPGTSHGQLSLNSPSCSCSFLGWSVNIGNLGNLGKISCGNPNITLAWCHRVVGSLLSITASRANEMEVSTEAICSSYCAPPLCLNTVLPVMINYYRVKNYATCCLIKL